MMNRITKFCTKIEQHHKILRLQYGPGGSDPRKEPQGSGQPPVRVSPFMLGSEESHRRAH